MGSDFSETNAWTGPVHSNRFERDDRSGMKLRSEISSLREPGCVSLLENSIKVLVRIVNDTLLLRTEERFCLHKYRGTLTFREIKEVGKMLRRLL